jgi:hypothetical protein
MHANGGGWCLKPAAMNVQGIDYLGALPLKLGKTVASPYQVSERRRGSLFAAVILAAN